MTETAPPTADTGTSQTETQTTQTEQTQSQATEQQTQQTSQSEQTETTLLNQKTEEKKTETKSTVPEKYEFTPPKEWEGKDWQLDSEVIDRATPMFKELGLSNDQAQKLVEFYAQESQKDFEATMKLARDQNEEWQKQVKADPEIGGKLDQVKTTISKAIDGLGDPKLAKDFREAMDFTGAGNNPAFIRAFWKLAQKVTEGSAVSGGGPSEKGQQAPGQQPKSMAKAMYPNLPSGA